MILIMSHVAQYEAQNAKMEITGQGVCGFSTAIHRPMLTITAIWKAKGTSFFNFMDGLIRLYHHTVKDMTNGT